MALSRRLGVVAILGSCWFTAVACGDDDSTIPAGEAGAGGEGGDGDSNGAAGSKNNAGKGGMSTAGTAGKPNGGSAGSGGSGGVISGDGGTGEVGGGAGGGGSTTDGGTGPTTGGAGGDTGEGGAGASSAGGEGGAPVTASIKACSYDCLSDNDCIIPVPDQPSNTDNKCNTVTKKCENPTPLCAVKNDCVPDGSFWLFTCSDDDGCFPGEACVTWGNEGYCASAPDAELGCITGGAPEALPHHGAQGTVEVCVDRSWICGEGGACEPGCTPEQGCGLGQGDTCNVETGTCECTLATECDSDACGDDGKCAECATDAHCAETVQFTGNDVCVEGTCGCSAANKCPDPGFATATAVCE